MGKLIILGTTLGNLEDTSIRALRAIFESPVILAEDTRVYTKYKGLLKQRYLDTLISLGISHDTEQKVSSYRDQSHQKTLPHILELLKEKDVVLTSDAGMPAISDPGWLLIEDVLKEGYEIDVIPGPTAISTSLVLSGLPTDRFTFLGFPPRKRGKLQKFITPFLELETTIVLYESPYRVEKTVQFISEIKNTENLQVSLVSEITKKHQKVINGSIDEVKNKIKDKKLKGEWVILLRNYSKS